MKKSNIWAITGITIGVIGIVGPILWDYYISKSELYVKLLDVSKIIERPSKLDELIITYKGEELEELSKTVISVANTGRRPILNSDFIQPLSIQFSTNSKIVDAKIELMKPKDLGVSLVFNKLNRKVTFNIPLMNSGDLFTFSALSKTTITDFSASARIVGIRSLLIDKHIIDTVPKKPIPWTVYPVALFTILMFLASFVGISHIPGERKFKKLIKEDKFIIPELNSKSQFINWINDYFIFITLKEKNELIEFVISLDEDPSFSITYEKDIINTIRRIFTKSIPTIFIVFIVQLLVLFGVWYVFTNI